MIQVCSGGMGMVVVGIFVIYEGIDNNNLPVFVIGVLQTLCGMGLVIASIVWALKAGLVS